MTEHTAEKARDRTVHGTGSVSDHTWEVVRYDIAGKWYLEHTDCAQRRQVSLDVAVRSCDTPYLGRSGGQRFDAKVRALSTPPTQAATS